MPVITGITGNVVFVAGYDDNPFSWTVTSAAESLDITVFGATWKGTTTGLKSWTGSYQAWVDDTVALPTAGDTGAVTLTADVGRTYSGTIHVISYDVNVSEDGSSRVATCNFEGDSTLTPA